MTDQPHPPNRERKPLWLTVTEVARVTRVSEDAVRRRIASGTLDPRLVQDFDGDVRIHRSLVYPATSSPPSQSAPIRPAAVSEAAPAATSQPIAVASGASRWPGTWKQFAGVVVCAGAVIWMLVSGIGSNPAGLFCDEAEIALSTMQLIEDDLPSLRPALFYSHFDYHHLGALPLYAGAPILAVTDLSDWSVRLVSAVWSLLAVLTLVLTVRRIGWRHGEIAVVAFALTPVFIHLGRVQFGHAPSFFCTAAGYYAWVRSREQGSWRWAAGSGLVFGASMYGQAAWYIAAPILVGGLLLGEVFVTRGDWRSYRTPAFAVAGFITACVPIAVKILTDDRFMKRFDEKEREVGQVSTGDRIRDVLGQYDKYFNPDYLFRVGETGMPGGWNMRHAVPGAGELTWILLPLLIAGVVGVFRIKDPTSRVIGIGALVALILYPAPDVITTVETSPPYTFSTFAMMIGVPLLGALGMHWLASAIPAMFPIRRLWADWLLPVGVLAVVLIGAARFWTGPYDDYPNVSAGYYGWQYGAGPAIEAFQDNPGYDRYVLDGDFNSAFVFLDFYLRDDPELRAKAIVGWPDKATGTLRELYAVRAERYDRLVQSGDTMRRYMRVIDTIPFPNGKIALYIVEIGPEDQWGPREVPF